ncbi:MAG TPA: hypothetical protein VGS96_11010 [Thermoanaerobaculia bacterium]|jgi:hypothetical protein|nr:hypothetical protein [Thermoanaerobaculia bacterium]
MPLPVLLDDVARELDGLMEQSRAFINRETGDIFVVTDDELSLVEEGDEDEEDDDLPEWQKEMMPTIREIVDGEKWLPLPNKFDIHEWEIMRRFADSVEDDDLSDDLHRAIHGRGAFRMFRATVEDAGVREGWFAFKHEALREMAREALEELGIPYR